MPVLITVLAVVFVGGTISSASVHAADRDSIDPIVAPPTDPVVLQRIGKLGPGQWLVVSAFGDANVREHGNESWAELKITDAAASRSEVRTGADGWIMLASQEGTLTV